MSSKILSPASGDSDRRLDTHAAAKFLGVSPATLEVWRCTGRYDLPFLKVGRLVRYRETDLARWLDARVRTAV